MTVKQIKIILGIVLLISTLSFLTYLYIENKKEKLKSEIVSDIENLMQGKKLMMDGMLNENIIVERTEVPKDEYLQNTGIKRYYKLISGGFGFYVIENTMPDVYEVYNIVSNDLAYKNNKFNEIDEEYPLQKDCYKISFNFFKGENPKYQNAFLGGSAASIQKIIELKNRYYRLGFLDNSLGFQSEGHPHLSSYQYNLFYTIIGQKYTIKEVTSSIIWDYILYIGIELLILSIIYFIIFYKPQATQQSKNENE